MRESDNHAARPTARASNRRGVGFRGAAILLALSGLAAAGVSACGAEPETAKPDVATPAESTSSRATDDVPPLVCGTALPPTRPDPPRSGPQVTISDRTGRAWDISSAVYKYGFDAGGFDYGLGVDAIPPIDAPGFLNPPGDERYPSAGEDFALVGIERAGEARAYPIDILTRHEIANDFIAGAYLAVGY